MTTQRTNGAGPGSHYTPRDLAREHTLQAFRLWNWSTSQPDHERASVLDLGCGDGAFICQAIENGVPPDQITGVEIDPESAEFALRESAVVASRDWATGILPDIVQGDALFTDLEQHDIALGNPPWIGKVSQTLGTDYAKRVAKRFGPDYNAASDLSAAFVIRASELCDQISFLCTNTIMQGRTYRSGIKRLLLSGEWAMFHGWDKGARFNGMGVTPTSHKWPGAASAHYVHVHLVRLACERFECFQGGEHWTWT